MSIICPACDSTFCEKDEVNGHLQDEHEDDYFTDTVSGLTLSCLCDHCDTLFDRAASQVNHRQYCDGECFKDSRESQSTDPSYGPKFWRVRGIALERAGVVCERCEFSNEDHKRVYCEGLHAHHIQKVDHFDHPDEAHTLDNLEILCKQCHLLEHDGNLTRPF